jgi:hypothetical protein
MVAAPLAWVLILLIDVRVSLVVIALLEHCHQVPFIKVSLTVVEKVSLANELSSQFTVFLLTNIWRGHRHLG